MYQRLKNIIGVAEPFCVSVGVCVCLGVCVRLYALLMKVFHKTFKTKTVTNELNYELALDAQIWSWMDGWAIAAGTVLFMFCRWTALRGVCQILRCYKTERMEAFKLP